MKLLSRDFTRREKILILLLAVVLIGLSYYKFVDQPVRKAISEAKTSKDTLNTEIQGLQVQVASLDAMQSEVDEILSSSDNVSYMESYNASKPEINFLNDILEASDSYNVSFADVTRDGDQIRRDISLRYTAPDYETAKSILIQLHDCEYRCLIKDINFNQENNDQMEGPVTVSLTATFFETMVDGTPDSGLPAE